MKDNLSLIFIDVDDVYSYLDFIDQDYLDFINLDYLDFIDQP